MELQKSKEEKGIVLDYLPNGYPFDPRPMYKKTPIVQILGTRNFTLLECVPKKEVFLTSNDLVYIGDGKRDRIHHIVGKLSFEKLTSTAMTNLDYAIRDVMKKNEKTYVEFFNKAGPLTTRMHQLQLLPGIGKKHMWEIIDKREENPFENFEDIKKRVKLLADPHKVVLKRIKLELEGNEKHRLFT